MTPPGDDLMLTDGGLETVLVFEHGLDLPAFAAFPLLDQPGGRDLLTKYHHDYLEIAASHDLGYVLETPTWRANRDWGAQLGYAPDELRRVLHDSVELVAGLRGPRDVVSGCMGPRGDGYVPGVAMRPDEAADYHRPQVKEFAESGADLVSAFTLSYVDEAIGIAAAAAEIGIPAVIGWTVETDGRLASGPTLQDAIAAVDASTAGSVAWFMVNCAHPDHVALGLDDGAWTARIGALRANASRLSHAELDEAEQLDAGDPDELAAGYASLRAGMPGLRVVGGCCGTDARHVAAIARELTAQTAGAS